MSKSRLVLVLLVIGFSSELSRKWREIFKPITKQGLLYTGGLMV